MFDSHDKSLPMPPAYPRWLGDIGGTNARFGWQVSVDAPITDVHVLACADYVSLADAAMPTSHSLIAPRPQVLHLALPTPCLAMPLR